ncbi:right-handed parallel beta-helix repeat-containing protein [candidate division KSB1 bacterium]|nr:right-handed parallel beta-helix repeat-containing protein [candidate division KSB1 bacterium]
MKQVFISFVIVFIWTTSLFAQIYVATDGLDNNPGTIDEPLLTISNAIYMANPGDTIYVRGGTYVSTATIYINSSSNGTEDSLHCLFAYPGELPVLDFSTQSSGKRGISLRANYWHIKGLEIYGAGDNGMEISAGSYNIVEQCSFHENRDSGVQLSNGAAYNRIINCDSYYNADPPDYGDADGFAPKLTVGTGNYFYGCRSWGNCDDGWDGYLRGATDVTTTLENCWTWGNGYLKDGTDPGSQANGNGFKMGGGDNSNSENLMHHFILKNCVAFENKVKGFDQNNNVGSMTLLNCTGFHNKSANYKITKSLFTDQILTVKNCVSFEGSVQLGGFAIQETNSWLSPFSVTDDDFISIDWSTADAPRQPDGSLPNIEFMHLATGSDLIDTGVDVGLPFDGSAPDLGAFETGTTASINQPFADVPEKMHLYQNYPNPFNPETTIRFILPQAGSVSLNIYNLMGQQVATLLDGYLSAGEHSALWQPHQVVSGVYVYRLQMNGFTETRKLVLQK